MHINVFEGARRITLLVGVVWAAGLAAFAWTDDVAVYTRHAVVAPDQSPKRTEVECTIGRDAYESLDAVRTRKGTRVYSSLCFVAARATDGSMVIPHKMDTAKGWWGSDRLSSEVQAYTKLRRAAFSLSAEDEQWADNERSRLQNERYRDLFLALCGGWAGLWIFSMVTGWIVRGFFGIPTGQDRRPASLSS